MEIQSKDLAIKNLTRQLNTMDEEAVKHLKHIADKDYIIKSLNEINDELEAKVDRHSDDLSEKTGTVNNIWDELEASK